MNSIAQFCLPCMAGAVLIAGYGVAAAQTANYPSKPIRFLVGVAPGGGTVFVARLIAARLSEKFPHVKAGRLTALAVTSEKRSPLAPEVATIGELGYPKVQIDIWQGILAPARTPPAIIEKMSRAIADTVAEPEVVQKLAAQGGGSAGTSPKVFAQFLKDESSRWLALAKEVNITAD